MVRTPPCRGDPSEFDSRRVCHVERKMFCEKKPRGNCKFCRKELVKLHSRYCNFQCKVDERNAETQRMLIAGVPIRPSRKRKFFIEKYGHSCWQCKLSVWQSKPIPLNLDHIDGNSENDLESNLRLLCLNCDGLNPTFGSKNWGSGRKERRKNFVAVAE